MATLLLLETATEVCSVGLSRSGLLLDQREAAAPLDHAREITLLIAACMQETGISWSDLDGVALSSGPGSYTSLRVGAAAAKGICYSLGKPLLAIDTLAALAGASQVATDGPNCHYLPMLDARRNEVYLAVYNHHLEEVQPPHALVLDDDALLSYRNAGGPLVLCGSGAAKFVACYPHANAEVRTGVRCVAANLVKPAQAAFLAGRFANAAYYEPLYLKPPFVTQPRQNNLTGNYNYPVG